MFNCGSTITDSILFLYIENIFKKILLHYIYKFIKMFWLAYNSISFIIIVFVIKL